MINRLKWSFIRFMSGRYGNDALGYFLLVLSFLVSFGASLFPQQRTYIVLLSYLPLVWEITRFFSRQVSKRQRENAKFVGFIRPYRKETKRIVLNLTQRQFRHFACPSCGQLVRVPAHRGRIEISCPHCRKTFTKKT